MHYKSILLLIIIVAFSGCAYKAPLVEKSNIKINSKLLGSWYLLHDNKKSFIHILQLSAMSYLIHLQYKKLNSYMEGQIIHLEKKAILQIKFIGDNKTNSMKGYYQYLIFHLDKDKFSLSSISRKLIDIKTPTSKELKKVILQNINNKDLFSKSDEAYYRVK